MDWRRRPGDNPEDPDGIRELIARADATIGGSPLKGTTFLHTARVMLAHTREIEAAVRGSDSTLYVGFQTADKLDDQTATYRDLTASGVDVVAYGVGQPAEPSGVRWAALPDQPQHLENQWFLVARHPELVAFVGFETSPERLRAAGPAGGPGKTWEGFVSDDERLVDALIEHLAAVAERHVA